MSSFSHYSIENLFSICNSNPDFSDGELNELLYELESRKQKIERDLVDIGIPPEVVRFQRSRRELKENLEKLERINAAISIA